VKRLAPRRSVDSRISTSGDFIVVPLHVAHLPGRDMTAQRTNASTWVSTKAGAHLRGRRKQDTAPELLLRSVLHAQGLRFRLHRRITTGCTPDIVLPRFRVAVFVDGCFWHGCPTHGRSSFSGPNTDLWTEKMRRNKERDKRSTQLATDAGWTVVRVWECEVVDDRQAAATSVTSKCMR
jgi:DNA mismatch endonuclease, patch repair protein